MFQFFLSLVELCKSFSICGHKTFQLAFIRPCANSTFQYHNPKSLKLITRLRLGLSHLRFHKCKHSFQDTLNPIYKVILVTKSTTRSTMQASSQQRTLSVNSRVWGRTWGRIRGQTWGRIRTWSWGQTWGWIRGRTWGRIRGRAWGQTWGRIKGRTRGRIRGQIWSPT